MGSRGPAPKAKDSQISYPVGKPPPPKWLSREGRREYNRAAELMGQVLTLADAGTLAIYAEALADLGQLTKELRAEGTVVTLANGVVTSNPKCAQRDAAAKRVQSAAAKLGFSPVDRARVPKPSASSGNPFDRFIGENFADV